MSDGASVAFGMVAAMFAVPVLLWVLLKVCTPRDPKETQ